MKRYVHASKYRCTSPLMEYIPKEFKGLVVDIYQGKEKEWDEVRKAWSRRLIVEWENGEVSEFLNKTFAPQVLREFHGTDEFALKKD